MKQKFKKFGMLVAMLLAFLPASAYDFEVDGFYYEIVSLTDLTCKVVAGDNKYEGEVVIPAEVTYNNRSLKVTSIGSEAFRECKSLTSVTIPDSVTVIGGGAFSDCSSLTSITIPDSVTEIGNSAFRGCKSLTSVTIPDSVTEIEDNAFYYCCSLTSVTIPDSVTKIGSGAFFDCSSLTSITIPDSVTEIEDTAFSYCSALENITLGKNLKRITWGMFYGCKSLSSLSIPGSVYRIEEQYYVYDDYKVNTFDGCESLKEVLFLYGEYSLEAGTYYAIRDTFERTKWSSWINELEKVFLDRELEYDLPVPNLKELTIGEHMTKLQVIDIDECNQLESIVSYAMTPPTVSRFSNSQYLNVVVKVPTEALEAYQKDSVWGNFWNLQGFDTSGVDDVEMDPVEKTVVGCYDLNGRAVNEDYKGITIVRFSDGSTKKMVL